MNLPNKLTLSRLFAVIVIAVLYYVFKNALWNMITIFSLFILASFTDFLDGHIARKNNMVTGFGKLMDPLADKMLVITAIIILFDEGIISYSWLLIIVVARELFVLGIRLVALEQNANVIAADILGKMKTLTQMVSISILLVYSFLRLLIDNLFTTIFYYIGISIFYVSILLLIVSGVEVFIKNKKYFKAK